MIPWLVTSLAACIGVIYWSPLENPIWAIVAANISGVITLLLVQKVERTPQLKTRWLKGPLGAWTLSIVTFGLGLVGLVPELRDTTRLLFLYVPLAFCAGLLAPWIFGPIQDAVVRRLQRKAQGFTDTPPRAKS